MSAGNSSGGSVRSAGEDAHLLGVSNVLQPPTPEATTCPGCKVRVLQELPDDYGPYIENLQRGKRFDMNHFFPALIENKIKTTKPLRSKEIRVGETTRIDPAHNYLVEETKPT